LAGTPDHDPENGSGEAGAGALPPPAVPGEAVGPSTPRPPRGATFRTLRIRNFRLLFSGTIVSQTGDFLQLTAQGWLVLVITGSPLSLGVVGFAQAAPRLALAPVVGKLADRFDRRNLLLLAQAGFLLQTLVFALLVTTRAITFRQIVALTVVWGALNAVNHTARQSLIPNIVPRKDLMSAIAVHSAAFNLTRALGPALGGTLVAWLGVAGCLWINAVTFLPLFWMLIAMDIPRLERRRGDGDERFRQAIRFVWNEPDVRQAVGLAFAVAFFALGYSRLTPAFARDIFGRGPETFGLLLAAPGIGALMSTLSLARFGSTEGVPRVLPGHDARGLRGRADAQARAPVPRRPGGPAARAAHHGLVAGADAHARRPPRTRDEPLPDRRGTLVARRPRNGRPGRVDRAARRRRGRGGALRDGRRPRPAGRAPAREVRVGGPARGVSAWRRACARSR
jgi:MFS family permease